MSPVTRRTVLQMGALALGAAIFVATIAYMDVRAVSETASRLGVALPLALFFSGLWHLVRTWAWAWCFPQPRAVGFAELARVRLAAEAFSYLTLRGIAGEPLKVVFLAHKVDARQATAAVALERIAYLTGTIVIVGLASVIAMAVLPLTRLWFRVFRAFAIAAAVITIFAGIVISGRGTYIHSFLRRIDRVTGWRTADRRVGRFITAVEMQMLDLVRENPRRLVVLSVATAAAYACMAMEAWVILRATGVPVSITGSVAIETFSRVASFLSAFIPANLGALEASSLAAVAAVGATGGGVALAVARRIRGLFWAAIGLALFPRRRRDGSDTRGSASPDSTSGSTGTALLYFPLDPETRVSVTTRLAGLPIAERIVRAATRAGYSRIVIWLPGRAAAPPSLMQLFERSGAIVAGNAAQWRHAVARFAGAAPVTVIGAGSVVSTALLADATRLMPEPGDVLDVPAGREWPDSGVLRMTASDAADPSFVVGELANRQRRAIPVPSGSDISAGRARLALRIVAPQDLATAEQTIRLATYKDTDATLARFNRRMSLPISIALVRTPLTANQLSVILVAIGLYAAWLFSLGSYLTGVLGAFLSLAASVLDGCDGEIARLKYQESRLGCWIETVGDYSYYTAIFIGLTIGAVRQTGWEAFYWLGVVALTGTLLSFALLIYLRSRITAGRPEKLHAIARERFQAEPSRWSRVIWRISFVATRSAMPYGIMAFALAGLLPGIVVLAAIGANVYWVSLVARLRDLLGPDDMRNGKWQMVNGKT